jgi:ribonuclease BN (tRNA processing enzyme)
MQIDMYGTRGSTPGQPRGSHAYGGNTTCLRVKSDCIPAGYAFAVDAGSGFVQLSQDVLGEGIRKLALIFTHYHHDHTQGLFLAPHTFMAEEIQVWGPREHGIGPSEVLSTLMRSPYFPVDFPKVKHRFHLHPMDEIGIKVLVIHPEGGFHLLPIDKYRQAEVNGRQLAFQKGRYAIAECLVVFMYKTTHPEQTISYRFEEKPTGRTFVFLTDHEKTAAYPVDMLSHLRGAHLLVQDGQYSESVYQKSSAGYGHATPEYCVETMIAACIDRMGITHHDPKATDADIQQRVEEARSHAKKLGREIPDEYIFACADYDQYTV